MKFNELFGGVVVKEGYTMLALVTEGFLFHAIIRRNKTDDYVMCYGYDVKDGTWAQGHYCTTYAGAVDELVKVLQQKGEVK